MTEAEEIVFLKEKMERDRIQYYRVVDQLKNAREEVRMIKEATLASSKSKYVEYLQLALSMTERQYEELLDKFEKLNNKLNHEMAKRQYIFPSNRHGKIPTVEVRVDQKEYEQI